MCGWRCLCLLDITLPLSAPGVLLAYFPVQQYAHPSLDGIPHNYLGDVCGEGSGQHAVESDGVIKYDVAKATVAAMTPHEAHPTGGDAHADKHVDVCVPGAAGLQTNMVRVTAVRR